MSCSSCGGIGDDVREREIKFGTKLLCTSTKLWWVVGVGVRGEVRVFFLTSGDGGAKWSWGEMVDHWGEMVVGRNGRPFRPTWGEMALPFRPKWGEMGRNDWGEMALGRND